jgi:hypothetical protein
MSIYGLRIKDMDGNVLKITPEIANVISVGEVTMPNSLVDTDKYYYNIDLPGTDAINVDNICCILNYFRLSINIFGLLKNFGGGSYYVLYAYLDDAVNNYTKNLSTGVMTAFTPGPCSDPNAAGDWDLICTMFPDTYWDKFADLTVTGVKIFSAMRYHSYDGSASAFIDAFQLGSNGVNKVDYAIAMRRKVIEIT